MAHLFDLIRRADAVMRNLDIPVVDASNVTAFWGQCSGRFLNVADFPCLMPPYEKMFVETRAAGISNAAIKRWGILCSVLQPEHARQVASDRSIPISNSAEHFVGLALKLDGREDWGFAILSLDTGGRPLGLGFWEQHLLSEEDLARSVLFLVPLLLALSLMHCKNVTQVEHVPDGPVQRKATRKHGIPLVTYRVLGIQPMREVLRNEGRSDEQGLKKALHICRGHFATYSQDKPLFGRVAGTFWIPQHLRGAAERGVVVKDYNVEAPAPC